MPTQPPPTHILAAAPALWSQAGQAHWVMVQGQSMQPFLQPGDEVWVAPGLSDLRRGDVLVLTTPSGLLVHRLLRARPWSQPQQLWTQGDSNRLPDPVVSAASCLGRVLTIRRQGTAFALDTPRRRATSWLIASGLLAVNQLAALAAPLGAVSRLSAGVAWRLVRVFARLASR